MTIAQDMQSFGAFDTAQATASLWVFKKRPATGQMNPFTAVSVLMGDALRNQLKDLARNYQTSHTLVEEYSLLSQTSEGAFLAVSREGTLSLASKGWLTSPWRSAW